MNYLITGGCGFVGSNVAGEVLDRGGELTVFDNLSREGSRLNYAWLRKKGDFRFRHADIRNPNDVETAIRESRPGIVFHLAGQVAMTTSLENPRLDFESNTLGTHNLLEAVRKYSPETIVVYSSTNKVYGDLDNLSYGETPTRYTCLEFPEGFDESLPLNFQSPYGCSKGAADQYLLDYHRMFGIRTVVFRHSSMYGGNQHASYDQGWIGWFCQKALEIKSGKLKEAFTISGTGKQVRDVLHAEDMVSLYFLAVEKIDTTKGNVYNIGGGAENSLSLLELFAWFEKELDIGMKYRKIDWRASDQKVFIADISKISRHTGWSPRLSKNEGLTQLLEELNER